MDNRIKGYNDLMVKVFLMGDSVGKNCLLNSYSCGGPLVLNGLDYTWPDYTITITHNQKPLKLRLIIADKNELKRIKQIEYNDIFLICYAIDDQESFLNVQKWNIEIKKILPNPNIILVGTKIDLRKQQKEGKEEEEGASTTINTNTTTTTTTNTLITQEMGIDKAKEICAIKYMECSSLTYEGVKDIFDESINQYFTKKLYAPDLRKKSFLISPNNKKNQSKKSSCKTQ